MFKEEFKWPVLKKRWGDALIWIHIRRSLGGQRQVWDMLQPQLTSWTLYLSKLSALSRITIGLLADLTDLT